MYFARISILLTAWLIFLTSNSGAQSTEKEFSALATAIPFPPDAREMAFDALFDDIAYQSSSSLASLTDFYRREMALRGWKEDVEEEDIDEDSVELTFRHDDAEVVLDLYQSSSGVDVRLDCEEIDFTGTDDPAALKAMGIPQPSSYLYLQRNIQLPDEIIDLEFERNQICFKCRMELQPAFDHFSSMIKKLGYKESRKPIIDDDRRYTEFTKGGDEMSVNIFTDEFGTRLLIGFEGAKKDLVIAPLPPVNSIAANRSSGDGKPDTVTPPEKDAKSPMGTAVRVANNRGEVVVTHGSQKYTYKHVAAFQTKYYGDDHTMIVFSDQPIPMNKMQQLIATEEDFSFGDLYEFDLPSYISISLNKYTSFSFSVPGVGIGRGIENPETEISIEKGRVTASVKMPAEEIFDKPFSFVATAEAGLITPHTRLSNFADPPDPQSPAEQMGIAGIPLPEEAEDVHSEGSTFRKVTHATVALQEFELVMFFGEELADRGWEEESSSVTPEATTFHYRQPGKTLSIALKLDGDNTKIEAVLLDQGKAKAAGLLPEPGKGRLVMGNSHTQPVVISIGKRNYTLQPGKGVNNPKDALNYSVGPGTYTLTIKIPGEQPQTEKVKIDAGTTWGIITLPTGGYFTSQFY